MRQLRRMVIGALATAAVLAALSGAPAPARAQATLFVDPAGDDGADCQTPATACRTLGAALEKAADGATVSLAAGRYPEQVTIRRGVSVVGAGADSTVLDSAGGGTVVTSFSNTALVTLQGLTITGGSAVGGGGGIANFGPMAIVDSVVAGNRVSLGEGFQGLGGGIFSFGTLSITGTSVLSNTGVTGAGINSRGSLHMVNSTIGANTASAAGGGLVAAPGTAELVNVTVSGNTAAAGGGLEVEAGGTLTLANTIVAGNTAADGPDCRGPVGSLGGNLVGDAAGCGFAAEGPGDQSGVDPLLGPLADNGGPTPTFALAAGSPAIDSAEPSLCPEVDQRGVARPQGPGCDSGAFELEGAAGAATWYVAPDGDDGNDCLAPDRPCATFARALALAGPGDTVRAAAGTYEERLRLGGELRVEGAGAESTVVDAGGAGTALSVDAGARASVSGLTLTGGAAASGAGVQNYGELTLELSVVRENRAALTLGGDGLGGGVANYGSMTISATAVLSNSGVVGGGVGSSGALTVTDSLIAGNVGLVGGGLASVASAQVRGSTVSGNLAVLGGGIANFGRMTIGQTSVLSNTALIGAGILSYGPLELETSVIFGNAAGEAGGGVRSAAGGDLTMRSSTVTANTAPQGGGVSSADGGSAWASGSIIAGNGGAAEAGAALAGGASPDCDRLASGGYNLIGSTAGCALERGPGDLLDVDARLGAPAPGRLPVVPMADSPALDAAAPCAGADQRGVRRPQGAGCDIGAIERRPVEAALGTAYLPLLQR